MGQIFLIDQKIAHPEKFQCGLFCVDDNLAASPIYYFPPI
jgi:hypothetical protein